MWMEREMRELKWVQVWVRAWTLQLRLVGRFGLALAAELGLPLRMLLIAWAAMSAFPSG